MVGEFRRRFAPTPATLRTALVGFVVLAAAFVLLWLVGRSLDRNRATASNSQLVADVQVARATLESDVAVASRKAAALARMPRVQSALARGDAADLQAVATAHPDTLLVSARGVRAGSLAPLGVRRILPVVSGGKTIGRIVTDAPLDDAYLARARESLPSHDLLAVTERGRVARGPLPAGFALSAESPRDVHAHGHTYRALGSKLVSDRADLRIVALARSDSGFLSAWRLPLAVFATLAAIAVVVLLSIGLLRRQDRRRPVRRVVTEPSPLPLEPVATPSGMSVAMLGERLAASKDVDALLHVILDAAIKATGASGGRVARPGETVSHLGESEEDVMKVLLHTNEPEGDSMLLLYPPAGGFSAEAAGVAHWLGAHAGTAIRDARFHRVVQDQEANDALTGLANRTQFTAALQHEFTRAEKSALPLAVVLADLDDFKAVNDRFGVQAGDDVLKAFAATLQRCAREIDSAARIGGEQFGVVLPATDSEGATRFAERLRSELAAEQGLPAPVTASYGIASYPRAATAEALLSSADASLRQAKRAGKNRVVAAEGPLSTSTRA
jgi:diguanylate cyclase (GGDEF)-like protein